MSFYFTLIRLSSARGIHYITAWVVIDGVGDDDEIDGWYWIPRIKFFWLNSKVGLRPGYCSGKSFVPGFRSPAEFPMRVAQPNSYKASRDMWEWNLIEKNPSFTFALFSPWEALSRNRRQTCRYAPRPLRAVATVLTLDALFPSIIRGSTTAATLIRFLCGSSEPPGYILVFRLHCKFKKLPTALLHSF